MVSETEESLQHVGVDYVIGRGSYGACARGRIIGDSDGFLKLAIFPHIGRAELYGPTHIRIVMKAGPPRRLRQWKC